MTFPPFKEPVDHEIVRQALRAALRTTWRRRPDLVSHEVCERSVVAYVAQTLAPLVAQWDERWQVDVEYNRWHEDDLQRFQEKFLTDPETGQKTGRVFPDLIVHQPGHSSWEHNLLVLEAKKGHVSPQNRQADYRKLRGFITAFGYQQAVFLEFDGVGGCPRLQWFADDGPEPDPTLPAAECVDVTS